MADYLARIADHELETRLRARDGRRFDRRTQARGKTATGSRVAKTISRFDEDRVARGQVEVHTRFAL